jgi:hypothetical protein
MNSIYLAALTVALSTGVYAANCSKLHIPISFTISSTYTDPSSLNSYNSAIRSDGLGAYINGLQGISAFDPRLQRFQRRHAEHRAGQDWGALRVAHSWLIRNETTRLAGLQLVGLSLANAIAGCSGAFVVNGSPTKTAMVDTAGGRSQWSHVTTATVVLMVLLFLEPTLVKNSRG